MSDLTVRDHSEPCKHGFYAWHDYWYPPSGGGSMAVANPGGCPGGRKRTFTKVDIDVDEGGGSLSVLEAWVEVTDD